MLYSTVHKLFTLYLQYILRDILQFDYSLQGALDHIKTEKRTCDLILGVGDAKVGLCFKSFISVGFCVHFCMNISILNYILIINNLYIRQLYVQETTLKPRGVELVGQVGGIALPISNTGVSGIWHINILAKLYPIVLKVNGEYLLNIKNNSFRNFSRAPLTVNTVKLWL